MPIELHFADSSSVDSEMQTMTMSMIVSTIPEYKFSRQEKRCWHEMMERVATLPEELQKKLRSAVNGKQMDTLHKPKIVLDDGDC